MDQIIIKVALILALLLLGAALLRPGGTARAQAIRTLLLVIFLGAAIVAVLVPRLIDQLAHLVGVGRGTDLVLYVFLVVFIGQALSTTRKRREQDAQITELARKIALSAPMRRDP